MKREAYILLAALILLVACVPASSTLIPIPSVTALPTTTALPAPTVLPTPVPNELYVDAGVDLGPISPYVYGSNYGPWTSVPSSMFQDAFDAHITALRFPGGRWGDENDIQTYHLDTFMAFCQKMGAIPTISVRFQNSTPEAAAALVHYANIEKGYNIIYWSIGNEPDYENLDGKKIDPVYYNQQWRLIAKAMKAVDPKIKLMGPELSQWGTDISSTAKYPPVQTPSSQVRLDWMTEFLKANGDLVDIVTVHRYPLYSPSIGPVTVEQLRQNTREWNQLVIYLRTLVHDITGRNLPVAFTEVNSDPSNAAGGIASPDSFYNAIWYADVLGRLIQENVFMVNNWLLGGNSGGLPVLYPGQIRPTYYVFQMYNHFGNEQVLATAGVADVTVYAAKRPDGTLTVMVINLADTQQRIPFQVQGMALSRAEVWLFDATHKAEDLGQQSFPADGRLILPAQSISLYAISQ